MIERRYVLPHIAHARWSPSTPPPTIRTARVEVFGSIQSVTACQDAVAAAVGCPADTVKVNVTFLGGSFGRKIVPDFVVQAVHASKAVGRPGEARPLARAGHAARHLSAERGWAVPGGARPCRLPAGAVHARVVGQSLFGATRKSWLDHTPEGDWDESMVDGIYNQSYRLPNFLVETIDTPLPIPVYFMRSVGSTAGVFFWESFISALARHAGIDQFAYRRNLLTGDPLALGVLDAVAQASNWASPPPDGVYRGIAYNCYVGRGGRFKTYVAEVVELYRERARLAVRRVYCAVDPGLVVNPNTLTAQIEGGIGFAMTHRAQEQDHVYGRWRSRNQLHRLPADQHRRDAGGRAADCGERPAAAGVRRGGVGAARAGDRAGRAARDRPRGRRRCRCPDDAFRLS